MRGLACAGMSGAERPAKHPEASPRGGGSRLRSGAPATQARPRADSGRGRSPRPPNAGATRRQVRNAPAGDAGPCPGEQA